MTVSPPPPYDYLVVGAGMYGSTFARLATDRGKKVLIIEQRPHVAGNCYTKLSEGIHIHRYGPHIFHTSNVAVWAFLNRFTEFNNYINSPLAISRGELFSLPFNMYTFHQLWGVLSPQQARAKLQGECVDHGRPPENLEEQALSLVGPNLYERLIRGYTKKQWQKDPTDLPPEIIRRLPLRFTYNCNYFNDRYQGIPIGGYTRLFQRMLDGIEVKLSVDFFADRAFWESQAETVVYTGKIDEFFDFASGELEYRTLEFEDTWFEGDNAQGNAVINYCDEEIPYTRRIEHLHFDPPVTPVERTVVTKEIPARWSRSGIPYYPINNATNMAIYEQYRQRTETMQHYIFGGRLAEYKYYDMHAVCGAAMLRAQAMGLG
jgi:UDP-galactopyranose mutase